MNKFNALPKTIKKTIRYIHQDASYEQALEIKKMLDMAIARKMESNK
ncbi:hypothetical protein [Sutcliffiella cohnii]|nr:hypothetical protein [Sutcliffiella cohnii]